MREAGHGVHDNYNHGFRELGAKAFKPGSVASQVPWTASAAGAGLNSVPPAAGPLRQPQASFCGAGT